MGRTGPKTVEAEEKFTPSSPIPQRSYLISITFLSFVSFHLIGRLSSGTRSPLRGSRTKMLRRDGRGGAMENVIGFFSPSADGKASRSRAN